MEHNLVPFSYTPLSLACNICAGSGDTTVRSRSSNRFVSACNPAEEVRDVVVGIRAKNKVAENWMDIKDQTETVA